VLIGMGEVACEALRQSGLGACMTIDRGGVQILSTQRRPDHEHVVPKRSQADEPEVPVSEHCKREIPESWSTDPTVVTIDCDPEIGPDKTHLNFCCWECAAMWFNVQAGEILMPDLDSEYWHEYVTS
jgi:hypothetical protein